MFLHPFHRWLYLRNIHTGCCTTVLLKLNPLLGVGAPHRVDDQAVGSGCVMLHWMMYCIIRVIIFEHCLVTDSTCSQPSEGLLLHLLKLLTDSKLDTPRPVDQ